MGNAHANIRNWIKMDQEFMPVLIVCMFDEDLIKQKWSRYRPDNIFPIICLWETKWQVPYLT